MSKAFTREPDEDVAEPAPRRRGVPVPAGAPNYVTAAGARALRAEHDALARRGDLDADAAARLAELAEHLATAQIVEPAAAAQVTFGAAVTVEDDDGARRDYRIVGAIEADPRRGAIGWQSPLARALLGAKVGDAVALPRGATVEIVAIRHDA